MESLYTIADALHGLFSQASPEDGANLFLPSGILIGLADQLHATHECSYWKNGKREKGKSGFTGMWSQRDPPHTNLEWYVLVCQRLTRFKGAFLTVVESSRAAPASPLWLLF